MTPRKARESAGKTLQDVSKDLTRRCFRRTVATLARYETGDIPARPEVIDYYERFGATARDWVLLHRRASREKCGKGAA